MVPLLTGVLGLSQHRAHGTSLAIVIFVATAGLVSYAALGNMEWRLVGVLAMGSVVGVYAGARLMQRLPSLRLRQLFALFLLAVAVRMLVT